MANADRPRGLWPIRHLTGGEIRVSKYGLTVAGSGTELTRGDPVMTVSDGTVIIATADLGGDTTFIVGVCAGVSYKDASGNGVYSDYLPDLTTGFTEVIIYVWDDPDIVFGIQDDGDTTTLAATNIHNCADIIFTGSVSTKTKLSVCELDGSTADATARNLKILGKIDRPDNAWGLNVDLEVLINQHAYKAPVAGI